MNGEKRLWFNSVFWVSAIVIAGLSIIGAVMPGAFQKGANAAFGFTTYAFGWFYLISVFLFCVFCIYLVFSKYGKIRLGKDEDRPQYSFFSWIGMLFSCGFGVGIVFYGVAEPMSHFFTPPHETMNPLTEETAREAMKYSFFHWGISQWSVFAVVGLAIGYFQYRKGTDGMISTTMKPLFKKDNGNARKIIDILAVIATVMGVATSLGLGILQINGGLNSVFGLPQNTLVQLSIVGILALLYIISTTTGLERGIKWLSNLNLSLTFLLMIFVFVTGPTVFILNTLTVGIGDYVSNFIEMSFRLTPYRGTDYTWVQDWTIFYWAWAIAWSPFVGAFVARVSRGRTIREFIFGVLIVPPLVAIVWIAIFGGTALNLDLFGGTSIAEAVNNDLTQALFVTLQELPFTTFVSILALLLILTFLVTSADSAVYILGVMTSKGSLNPSIAIRVIWGILIAVIAAVLIISSGLEGLQTASLVSALPFTVILALMCLSVYKLLRQEPHVSRRTKRAKEQK